MSLPKKLFGYFLILFAFSLIVLIGFPQLYLGDAAGKIQKEKTLKLDFLKDVETEIVLLYFGYIGCENICTPAMSEIADIYKELDNKHIQVFFVNLQAANDKDMPDLFAKHFHNDFNGIYLNKQELEKLQKSLKLAYTQSLTDEYDINHSGHLYLLTKDKDHYLQKFIYTTRPFNKKLILKDIQQSLKEKELL